MRPLLHVNLGLSTRWFVRRWHANREYYAWRGIPARAGASVGVGPLRVQIALLRKRRVGS